MIRQQIKHAIDHYIDEADNSMLCNLYQLVIDEVEKALLEVVMEHTDYNQTKAAQLLGINRNTLRRKLEKHELS